MSIQSITHQQNTIFSLDEILQDNPETATEELIDSEKAYQNYQEELNQELKATDRVWLEIHAGLCRHFGRTAKSILYRIVKASVNHPENSTAAANAISILNVMRVSFSCLNLKGVQIPDADLSSAILDRADLSGANLENVNLTYATLNYTDMTKANLKNVKFNVPDIFNYNNWGLSSIVSFNNKYLISEDTTHIYFWHIPSKTCIKKVERHNKYIYLRGSKAFLPDGQFLFIHDRKGNVDIWAIKDSAKSVKKAGSQKIIDKENVDIDFAFSPDGKHFITTSPKENISTHQTEIHLKLWEIQKKENNLLDINLKNEVITPFEMFKVCFSKKFPVFYCFEEKFSTENISSNEKTIYLSVYNLDKFFKVTNADKMNNSFLNLFIPLQKKNKVDESSSYSLAIADIRKDDEELLFIAVDNFIYSVHILKKNEQNWSLESTKITKVITEIDAIFDMQILIKTHELIYVYNDTICLYSIKNKQLIGKFRLFDRKIQQFSISSDEANIYISSSSRVYTFSIEALKNSNNIFYQMDNKATCFLADMRSIISISNSLYMTTYDIEIGNILRLNLLQKMPFLVSDKRHYKVSCSRNAQHALIFNNGSLHFLHINTKNEKPSFEISESVSSFVLNHSSEYLAIRNSSRNTLEIYKTPSSKQCIGQFHIEEREYTEVKAISKDFLNTPKVVLTSALKMTIFNFVFKDEVLALVSQKELPKKPNLGILLLQFIKNDSKLLVV